MKAPEQRQRMSEHNPMHNPETAKKNGLKHRRKVVIDNIEYDGLITAAEQFGVSTTAIRYWCKKGYNSKGQKCYYLETYKECPKRGKAVLIDGQFFSTIAKAAEYLKCSSSYLSSLLKEGKNTYKNHKCEYVNQQPSQENANNSILEGSTTNE